jgi:hypothetical protein
MAGGFDACADMSAAKDRKPDTQTIGEAVSTRAIPPYRGSLLRKRRR